MRKDTSIKGIDVLVRPDVEIEVSRFDGNAIPLDNRSVDVVMFVDVLHHTMDPMMLLREAVRVAATAIVIKDHLLEGFLAGPTLRLMDRVGNRRHGVALPYNYWNRQQWDRAWNELQLTVRAWRARLGLCPVPANLIFERCLHFLTLLEPRYKTR
jgi:SAM-dependent methyltransferase